MEGIYSYTTSEGYDDFLKERGVPWIGRKLIIAAPVQLEVGYNESGKPPKRRSFFRTLSLIADPTHPPRMFRTFRGKISAQNDPKYGINM